ncbi:MAG: hypothetical protein HWE22_16075 [Flavobacteriales bacterium]|nr:hypothetical protein [Flavobacteriales bacterium]
MRTSNGQDIRQAVVLINISDGTRHVSEVENLLTLNHLVFLDRIRTHGKDALIESLRSAHDSILYGSKVEIKEFRDVLFDLKQLGDWLERI